VLLIADALAREQDRSFKIASPSDDLLTAIRLLGGEEHFKGALA
jgi:hypothetical protein